MAEHMLVWRETDRAATVPPRVTDEGALCCAVAVVQEAWERRALYSETRCRERALVPAGLGTCGESFIPLTTLWKAMCSVKLFGDSYSSGLQLRSCQKHGSSLELEHNAVSGATSEGVGLELLFVLLRLPPL